MIYEYPDVQSPLQQGDIFIGIPRLDLNMQRILVVPSDSELSEEQTWKDVLEIGRETAVIVPVRPVNAIVISQNCDALRAIDITLCEIKEFAEVERSYNDKSKIQGKINIIIQTE